MKLAIAVLFSALAVSFAYVSSRDILTESVIKKILEELRPKIRDLEIPYQEHGINTSLVKAHVILKDGSVKKLDEFVIAKLTASVIPMKLSNLTLTWKEVVMTGIYNLTGELDIPSTPGPMTIFGDGNVTVELREVFFTIGANFKYTNGALQIPPKGLFGFDFNIGECKVNFQNLLGGGNKGETVNKFIGFLIPDFIRDNKQPLFEMYRDPLIDYLNDYLAGRNKTMV